MPFFDHNGAEVYYEIWGEGKGPWITLLNGLSRTSSDFKSMARFLNERSWRVLLVDNRGAGQTESPLGFTLNDCSADVVRLWDHLNITGSALLGISYGGVLAMHVALDAASRVQRLILVSTTADASDIRRSDDLLEYFSPTFAEAHEVMVNAFAKEMKKAFENPTRAGKAAAQRKAVEGVNLNSRISKILVPTLVLHGSEDRIVPLASAERLSEQIPKAKLEVFDGVGHLLLAEAPKRLYERVWEFCTQN